MRPIKSSIFTLLIICVLCCLSCSNSGKTMADQKTIDEVTQLLTKY
jgi:hypothetical protein